MDIDLVYLWVDGNDPVWLTKKNEFLPADRQVDPQVAGECRYVENDELRYSLRSVEKFAPWIRRVYIVTDDQTPAWLDTSNPRIRVVSHREIMPAEILPVFNSCTIELFLPRIPGLAEHFLYANDDMFFSRPVDPGFFFDWQGRPIVRLKVQSLKKHDDDIYCHTILRMQDLVRARYGRCSSLPTTMSTLTAAAIFSNAARPSGPNWSIRSTPGSVRATTGSVLWCSTMRWRADAPRCAR